MDNRTCYMFYFLLLMMMTINLQVYADLQANTTTCPLEIECLSDGNCITASQMCDRTQDCSDGADEDVSHCQRNDADILRPDQTCPPGPAIYRCADGITCISEIQICDNVTEDCPGGEDELPRNCDGRSCLADFDYSCPFGKGCAYVNGGYRCVDCDVGCVYSLTNCNFYYAFQCSEGYCIDGMTYQNDHQGTEGYCNDTRDECGSSPCQNGGTCVDMAGWYTCMCTDGFTGVNCETDIDECNRPTGDQYQHECDVETTNCNNVGGTYVCNCKTGFIRFNTNQDSKTCQVNKCASNPCRNGAVCKPRPNTFKCRCKRGFGGKACKRRCDRNCHGASGCDFYGPGKCDTRCASGFALTAVNNKCRDVRCKRHLFRLKNRHRCRWVYSKKKKPKKTRKPPLG